MKRRNRKSALNLSEELGKAIKLHQNGNLPQAKSLYKKIIRHSPNHPDALHMLGILYTQTGKLDTAVDLMRKSIKNAPGRPDYLFNLARAYHDLGNLGGAIATYQEYLRLVPDDPEALHWLGRIWHDKKAYEQAIIYYRQALAKSPERVDFLNSLGLTYHAQGDFEQAVVCYEQALKYQSNDFVVLTNLGLVQKEQGRLEEAKVSVRKALSVKDDHVESHFLLSSLHKYSGNEDHINEMKSLFSQQNINDEQKMYLAFGLGKAYEDSGVYEKAFHYFKEGNKLKRKTYNYSKEGAEVEFKLIKRTFSKAFVQNNAKLGNPDNTPIFVLGMPRSGTSLVEQILASHLNVYGAGELNYLRQIISQLTKANSVNQICENIPKSSEELITRLGLDYVSEIRKLSAEAKFITDKMPHNFLWIGAIILALPNAKIISCLRDPLDNCLSIYKNHLFAEVHKYAYDLRELGHYYLLFQDLMRYWHEVFPGKIYDISYEKLVLDQEAETRKLLAHCDLSWDDACLSFHKTPRIVATASAVQVRKPIYKNSVQLWKRYEKQLQSLRDQFTHEK
jgi:tetratricopeptide (TPR) repeat protein